MDRASKGRRINQGKWIDWATDKQYSTFLFMSDYRIDKQVQLEEELAVQRALCGWYVRGVTS